MNTLGDLEFACSFGLLGFISIRAARFLGSSAAERFWIAVAAAALQLGTLGTFVSLLGRLTPNGWLIAHVGMAVFAWLVFHRRLHEPSADNPVLAANPQPATSRWGQGLGVLIAGLLVLALALSAAEQALTLIKGFDERMYHASRALYWIENRSLLPYVTHNDRQVVFPFGAELFFAWPILFTRAEVVGRMVFWLGLPFSAVGVYTLIRELRLSRMAAAVWTLLFVLTPTVLHLAVTLKPALWVATFVLGTGFWLVRAYQRRAGAALRRFVRRFERQCPTHLAGAGAAPAVGGVAAGTAGPRRLAAPPLRHDTAGGLGDRRGVQWLRRHPRWQPAQFGASVWVDGPPRGPPIGPQPLPVLHACRARPVLPPRTAADSHQGPTSAVGVGGKPTHRSPRRRPAAAAGRTVGLARPLLV